MEFDLSKIEFSNKDIKRNIKIPKNLTKELAEFLGIMVGDGHVGSYKNKYGKSPYIHYEIRIAGNINEYDYYKYHVNKLIDSLFNVEFNLRKIINRNAVILSKDSKALYSFLTKVINLPQRKIKISIPKQILLGNKSIKSSFLRGYADADFSLSIKYKPKPYPVISGTSISKEIMHQVSKMLLKFGIKNIVYCENKYYEKRKKTYITHRVDINGFYRVNEFLRKVGFSNKNKTIKYQLLLKNRLSGPDGI